MTAAGMEYNHIKISERKILEYPVKWAISRVLRPEDRFIQDENLKNG